MAPTKDEMLSFAVEIEKISKEYELNYIESIVYYCDNRGIEIESVTKLIGTQLKSKLSHQAMELNLIKRKGRDRKLPI